MTTGAVTSDDHVAFDVLLHVGAKSLAEDGRLATKLCHLTSVYSGRTTEAIDPRQISQGFQKSLDPIPRFAAKGCSPADDVHPDTRREKTN